MKKVYLLVGILLQICPVSAGWWPFSSDDDEGPRLSELMEPASVLIDDATELAADGKYPESVAKYREALDELAKVERDYPDRAATTEFASLRNKRAYVNAAIDSLLLSEARTNAKAVAITDTTELEKKFLRRRGQLPEEEAATNVTEQVKAKATLRLSRLEKAVQSKPDNRKLRLALIGEYLKLERYAQAKTEVEELLKANATDCSALNLKAVCQMMQGETEEAAKTLEFAIQTSPNDYNAFYNLANLVLQGAGDREAARKYYESGRAVGGPQDEELEAALAK